MSSTPVEAAPTPEPMTIEEVQDEYGVWNALGNAVSYDDASGAGREGAPLSPGLIPVKIRVRVAFRLIANG